MKHKNYIAAVLTVIMFVAIFPVSAMATDEIMPISDICSCGGVMNRIDTVCGQWNAQGSHSPCSAHSRYDHLETRYTRTVTVTEECEGCGYTYSWSYNDSKTTCA